MGNQIVGSTSSTLSLSTMTSLPAEESAFAGANVTTLDEVVQKALSNLTTKSQEIEQALSQLIKRDAEHCGDIPLLKNQIRLSQSKIEELQQQKTALEKQEKEQEQQITTAGSIISIIGKIVPLASFLAVNSPYGKVIITAGSMTAFGFETVGDYLIKRTETTQESIKIEEKSEEKLSATPLEDTNPVELKVLQRALDQLTLELAKEKEAAPKGLFAKLYTDKQPEWKQRKEEIEAGKNFIKVFNENRKVFASLLVEQIDKGAKIEKLTQRINTLTNAIAQNSAANTIRGFSNHVVLLKEKIVSYIPNRTE